MTTRFLAFALLAAGEVHLCNDSIVELGFFGGKKHLHGEIIALGNSM
jgi:hypothetical protein